ncbi:hypothetical protein DEO72_LG8g1928 [Vigna unguiculata]|uniref:Uncharacterized protein n=1 Tax=Vigna unguiculata TaxID=3917 RepID=A0A4D6MS46_VIGUN|nr:hypothetical protein DEO72_LG8g1928 [Vigna unguiculata]
MAKLLDHHSLADHEDLAHLLPSTKLMIIARRTATYITNMQQNGLAQHLAQAEGSRSGETCSLRRASPRLGESTKKTRAWQHGISLKRDPSRLGELPARSKIERAARATFRAKNLGELPVSSRLGEIDSLGRDLQVSSLFFTVTVMLSDQTTHARYLYTSKRQIQPYNQQITHKQIQKRLETRTLASRTWKRANGTSMRDLGAQ